MGNKSTRSALSANGRHQLQAGPALDTPLDDQDYLVWGPDDEHPANLGPAKRSRHSRQPNQDELGGNVWDPDIHRATAQMQNQRKRHPNKPLGFTPDGNQLILEWGGSRAQYHGGSHVLGKGAFGSVRQFKRFTDKPDFPQTLAIKEFEETSSFLQQEAAVRLVEQNPELRKYVVPALAIDGRIVMPSLKSVYKLDLRKVDPLTVWRQARDAVVAVHRLGLAYFDVKINNLLVDADGHVCLADIAGLMRPGTEPVSVINTYGYPGHDGVLMVSANTWPTIQFVTAFALIALGLKLLEFAGIKNCNPSEIEFTAARGKWNFYMIDAVRGLREKIARTLEQVPEDWQAIFQLPSDNELKQRVMALELEQVKLATAELPVDWRRIKQILAWCDPDGHMTPEFSRYSATLTT